MRYIIDTNIWIYLFEGRQELLGLKKDITNQTIIPVLTSVVFAEVLGWEQISEEKEQDIRRYFASLEMLPINNNHWEQIITWRKQGIKKKMPDLLIAANAKIANYPILTRNISDFSPLAIGLKNPFE
jgi:predicted nucleic acid-binding protein